MAAPEARGAGARPAPEHEYSPHRVAVIGSGIIGLSSAVCITRNLAGVNVTVISDQDQEDTTSFGAGGLWEPYSLGQTFFSFRLVLLKSHFRIYYIFNLLSDF
jgi:glycine/D-amino acid oxidase-like deaminating enzyme